MLTATSTIAFACGDRERAVSDGTTAPTERRADGADAATSVDAADAHLGAMDAADDGPRHGCGAVTERCVAWNVRSECVPTPSGAQWTNETCASGCFAGKCSTSACADECVLGSTSAQGTCRLYALASAQAVDADPGSALLDRARDYDRLLQRHGLREGSVVNGVYSDATHTSLVHYGGGGDSAIWTGSALAAQALRYIVTRSPDAHAQVASYVNTLHRMFRVSGEPGYLARVVVSETSTAAPIGELDCQSHRWHCQTTYDGQTVHWMGDTSRDQYTGVMLGYALAYAATADESLRRTIRDDVVVVARELMKSRDVPVRAELSIGGIPVAVDKTVTLENVILSPSEMVGGKLFLAGDIQSDRGRMSGVREFMPDLSALTKPLTGVAIPVPRAGSAIMLGAFIKMAIEMTRDVPGEEVTHQELADYYAQRAAGWLDVAALWSNEATGCNSTYYPNHITYVMAYVWALLESDATLGARIRDQILDAKLWAALKNDKNVYFAYLWAGARGVASSAPELAVAKAQLARFPVGPRIHVGQDQSARVDYPARAGCTNPPMSSVALDVNDRVVEDFMWQRSPYVTVGPAVPNEIFPGVDYAAAYWAGRRHGYLADDRPGTCTRWMP